MVKSLNYDIIRHMTLWMKKNFYICLLIFKKLLTQCIKSLDEIDIQQESKFLDLNPTVASLSLMKWLEWNLQKNKIKCTISTLIDFHIHYWKYEWCLLDEHCYILITSSYYFMIFELIKKFWNFETIYYFIWYLNEMFWYQKWSWKWIPTLIIL